MVHLKDYTAPSFWIRETSLFFDLHEDHARVRSKLRIERRKGSTETVLKLDGEQLQLNGVKLNSVSCTTNSTSAALKPGEYRIENEKLAIGVGELADFFLEVDVTNEPQKNLACEGLYRTGGMFCTQCEAESFRRITYYIDRPDVMSIFTVTVEADKSKYPILLSNGNRVSTREMPNGRHEATWHDPHKKPCYLFALVAGDLGCLRDRFQTKSGRDVALEIYCRQGLEPRCVHAMDSLKKSMLWDEERYGLEYDLDLFMIVVADEFNMGAMENKGLNVFNAHYVLADAQTATDKDFDNIQAVVGHEYFHNWTGNRVTCRDWFQLSLKEGLTVYRDQEFSADMGSRAVKRIEDVIRLRTHQFAEDAGPMAHAVRPQSYEAIDNFYTMTIYEKGAEVIRMIETLIGRDGFRKGMDRYFEMFDGQAVTTDDFVHAMTLGAKDVGRSRDFTQFKNWYDQAGTPLIKVRSQYDAAAKKYSLTISQSCAPSPGQPSKIPYLIPVAVGLLGQNGDLIPTTILELSEPEQTFTFEGIAEKPMLSLLRGFSAPVKVECEYSTEELSFLIAKDSDPVARWEATQQMMLKAMLANVSGSPEAATLQAALVKSLGPMLDDATVAGKIDEAFVSFMLMPPSENYISQFLQVVDVEKVFRAHDGLLREVVKTYRQKFESIYNRLEALPVTTSGQRALRNMSLMYLCLNGDVRDLERALKQRRQAKDMTTELGAIDALNRSGSAARISGIEEFREKWRNESLVMNKWLSIRALAPGEGTLEEVKALLDDSAFDKNNPNKIYSLLLAFAKFNSLGFHAKSGGGYKLIADQVLDVDTRNPQVASRLVSAFNQWKTFTPDRADQMKRELERIAKHPTLSNNVREIVTRALN
ncbi:MAG: aminopeptidase N [Deltaproteobacteria bacterium]|nr:aminopeptidase N [Deltaproteobacteria bacterium]